MRSLWRVLSNVTGAFVKRDQGTDMLRGTTSGGHRENTGSMCPGEGPLEDAALCTP